MLKDVTTLVPLLYKSVKTLDKFTHDILVQLTKFATLNL